MNNNFLEKNKSYVKMCVLSEKIANASIFAIVITVIAAIGEMYLFYMCSPVTYIELFDVLMYAKPVLYIILILLEVLVYRVSHLIKEFASSMLKYDDPQ